MEKNGADRPLIFISYSKFDHKSKAFIERHLGSLRHLGNVELWHDGEIRLGDDWFQKIEAKLKSCDVAVILISTDFLNSDFCMNEEVPALLERRKREGMMIAPILVRPCAWKIVPWLAAIQMLPQRDPPTDDDTPLLTLSKLKQEAELTKVVIEIHRFLEQRKKAEPRASQTRRAKADSPFPSIPVGAVDTQRLPSTGYELMGRKKELRMLDEAWQSEMTNIVSLVAWGGVGKSTLLNKWVEYLEADNYRGAQRVFAWSFYSQGTNERVTSADAFIDEALRFFDDPEPEAGSPWSKGERLAGLVGQEKGLLLLDGMEPLQDQFQGIKDPALSRLIECLAALNHGLCVITTRESVKELVDYPETTQQVDLEQILPEAGRALLRVKGVRGSDAELEAASAAFGNHALAINLLASFLKDCQGKHIEHAAVIPDLADLDDPNHRHPRRVMAAFAERFSEGPELDLLHIMGLFDRPASEGCIKALRAEPAIPGLTQELSKLDEAGWLKLLEKLRDLGLLAKASHHDRDELDAHPLVREHFGAQLRYKSEEACRAGHLRLYEHLKTVPKKHRPDSLAEMAPLFQAVHHGCQAGQRQDALFEVYHDRIVRRNEDYLMHKLGAYGADLGLVASFFDPPFERPAADLSEDARAWLLHQAAFSLRALGRLGEAVAPMRAAIEQHAQRENWREAANSTTNLSQLQLALGEVAAAEASGEAAIAHADRSGDDAQRVGRRVFLANARHEAGKFKDSKALFEEAEKMLEESSIGWNMLVGTWGYSYCDLLLTHCGGAEEVSERVNYSLARGNTYLLETAVDHISLGRAALALGNRDEARRELDQAVDGLREAGTMDYLPSGLLARAAMFRELGEFTRSRHDLDEAMRIAERGGMRLFQCDSHLGYARLALAEGKPADAREHLESAKALVSACGYHRRDGEVEALEAALA